MWNWRLDRQSCSRHWSGDRNWSCYRRLNVQVPALNFLHFTVETTLLFRAELKAALSRIRPVADTTRFSAWQPAMLV